jgi:hypothetical protein
MKDAANRIDVLHNDNIPSNFTSIEWDSLLKCCVMHFFEFGDLTCCVHDIKIVR